MHNAQLAAFVEFVNAMFTGTVGFVLLALVILALLGLARQARANRLSW